MFTPNSNLYYGITYTVTISSDVEDIGGNNMTGDYSWSFTAYKNPTSRSINYSADGDVSSYFSYTYDANGNQTRYVWWYTGSGADLIWFTSDDDVSSYYDYTYDANGNQTRYVWYTGSSADLIWFTSDDDVSYYYDYTYDANANRTEYISYSNPGPDLMWFTGDDVINYRQEFNTTF